MPPKKHNGFMAFVVDWRSKNPSGRGLSMKEAVAKCGPIWESMSAQQRGPYHSEAKNLNVLARASKKERLNCLGDAVSNIEMEQKDAKNAELQMKHKIERVILKANNSMELEEELFVFVSFNYFTKALTGNIYVPAEFSACRYSLKGGISSNYSTMINPGHIIFGQSSDAQHHSQTTHKLPLPPKAMGESKLGKLYIDILKWLYASNDEEDPVIVYTTPELMPVVKSCFRYMACDTDTDEDTRKIMVYDIHHLFHTLKKNVMDIAGLPNDHINLHVTNSFFEKDFFEYTEGIACDYHEEIDRSKYCTRSMVMRWGFIFSDYMCADLAIPLQPGKHIPPKVKPNYKTTPGDSSSGILDISTDSFYSALSTTKFEQESRDFSPNSSRQSVPNTYVPTDHSVYGGDLNDNGEFPGLCGGRPKPPDKRYYNVGPGKKNTR